MRWGSELVMSIILMGLPTATTTHFPPWSGPAGDKRNIKKNGGAFAGKKLRRWDGFSQNLEGVVVIPVVGGNG